MMGHRKNRKRDRRGDNNARPFVVDRGGEPEIDWSALVPQRRESLADMAREFQGRPAAPRMCGSCKEFVEDQDGGRGTCLHPGSGILAPWTDTGACQFFVAQRGVRLGR